jgi:hypothetical protein
MKKTTITPTTYHIKPYLKKRGFNLSALASSMEMSFQRFDHHIREKDDLSFNFVRRLSTLLNLSMDDFIDEIRVEK